MQALWIHWHSYANFSSWWIQRVSWFNSGSGPQPDLSDSEQLIYNDIDETHSSLTSFLDMTGYDEVMESNTKPVLEMISKLLEQVKKKLLFTPMLYLNSLEQFINLWTKYKANPKVKRPMQKTSSAIATSIGKGLYMACKICGLYRYISWFRTLPPTSKGNNHHAHPTLLNNE